MRPITFPVSPSATSSALWMAAFRVGADSVLPPS
jgi:hypothetical protein